MSKEGVNDNIPTMTELDDAIFAAKEDLKTALDSAISEMQDRMIPGLNVSEIYGSLIESLKKNFSVILDVRLSHLQNQILVGAHVSEIIRLIKVKQ